KLRAVRALRTLRHCNDLVRVIVPIVSVKPRRERHGQVDHAKSCAADRSRGYSFCGPEAAGVRLRPLIGLTLSGMKDLVLFQCCDATTSLVTLRAWRRWATRTVVAWLAGGVALAEGLASLLAFGPSVVGMVEMAVAGAVALLLAVPAIVLLPAIGEYERELRRRRALEPNYVPVEDRLPGYVLRMIAWFAVAIVVANYLV
ncbi:MAG TPA: hypothetical protein VGR35_20570, partial [Tepidisphaeraceae bacterium]|nr:hypothetical protein [Tepidisphaeraceae bacterium]